MTAPLSLSDPARVRDFIAARSTYNPTTSCRTWQRGKSSQGGYPTMWCDDTCQYVHRVAFALDHDLPDGSILHESTSEEVHHDCLDRNCVEPSHHELLTRRLHAQAHQVHRDEVRLAREA
jgi:hypothetical protein